MSDDSLLQTTLQRPATPEPLSEHGSSPNFESLKGDIRFETGELIGKGGMGAVFHCTDVRLKRDMARKLNWAGLSIQ